jgi:hypothetical protein
MNNCKICHKQISSHRIYCSNECKFSDNEYNEKRKKKRAHKNLTNERVRCIHCDYTSSDVNNLSGALTRHLKSTHDIVLDAISNHFKKFLVKQKPTWNCTECDWKTTDLENKSGCITNHLKNQHSISIEEYNIKYPNNKIESIQYRRSQKLLNKKNFVECKICGDKLHIISNTHCLNKHGITQEDYKKKYGDTIISEGMSNELKKCGGSKSFISKGETEVYEYIKSLGILDIEQSKYLGGIEIDIYSDEYKVGIEYNGLYWHSELNGRDKTYHIHKTEYCESKGIKLIHIFEDEWRDKQDIVKSRLKNLFNKSGNRLYARNCEIREIETKVKSEFLKKYHIQGNDKSKVKLGAFYKDELVSVCTFSDKRISLGSRSENGVYELNRFCSIFDTTIIGILPKFLAYLKNNSNVTKVITYADRRYSSKNNVYESVGFNYVSTTKPNYFYMKDYSERKHRFNYTKGKFVQMGGDKKLTEWENAVNMGFDRIWDCGSYKYEYVL